MSQGEIRTQCHGCREMFTIRANEEDIKDWQNGELIQAAMPYLTSGERELLISGICEECFHKVFI